MSGQNGLRVRIVVQCTCGLGVLLSSSKVLPAKMLFLILYEFADISVWGEGKSFPSFVCLLVPLIGFKLIGS